MESEMPLMLVFQDSLGVEYDLTNRLIDFATLQWGESKVIKAVLKNDSRTTEQITVKAVAHPTAQLGAAIYTYGACVLSLDESGPYVPIVTIGTMSPLQEKDIYIKWTMPDGTVPGYARFAVKAEGVTQI